MAETIKQKSCISSYRDDMIRYCIGITRRRALPEAKDSLKPVQRRNVYSMFELNAYGNKKLKSARIVGHNMGLYHAHGDSSIYDALEPLATPWHCKMPLFSPDGNWGNIIGLSPAAMRYTEIALSPFGYECVIGELADSKNIVDWVKNFDESTTEPEYLPVKVPLLLINGSTGIALGVSNDIPKHNLVEVINVTRELLHAEMEAYNQSVKTGKEVLPRNVDVVLIPDHCLPCKIVDTDWKDICDKGSGTYKARADITIEDYQGKPAIIINSLPDRIDTVRVTDKINDMIMNKELPMVTDMNDLSDKGNVRIVIQLKKGSDANFVRELIYKRTDCETPCKVNFEVVIGTDIKRMSYKEYLLTFLNNRTLTKFRLYCNKMQKVMTRWHKLDAFVKALSSGQIDKIIDMIRKRKSTDDTELIEYLIKHIGVTDMQAEFIINANIKQLSVGYLEKYKSEAKDLWAKRLEFEAKIMDKSLLLKEIDDELAQIAAKYGSPRICKVVKAKDESNIPKGTFKIVITDNNFIRKISETEKITAVRGDNPKFVLLVDNTESVLLFDNKGRVFKLPVHKIPITDKSSPGVDARMVIKGLTANIISVVYEPVIHKIAKMKEKHFVTVVTENNFIKKLDIQDFLNVPPSGIIYSKLVDNDSVRSIEVVSDKFDVLIYSNHKALRVPMSDIPCYKRASQGVLAMNTKEYISGLSVVYPNATHVIVITTSGKINKFNISGLETSARYKAGSSVIKLGKTDDIHSIYGTNDNNIIHVVMRESAPIDINVSDIPVLSSASGGTKMINVKSDMIVKTQIIANM